MCARLIILQTKHIPRGTGIVMLYLENMRLHTHHSTVHGNSMQGFKTFCLCRLPVVASKRADRNACNNTYFTFMTLMQWHAQQECGSGGLSSFDHLFCFYVCAHTAHHFCPEEIDFYFHRDRYLEALV